MPTLRAGRTAATTLHAKHAASLWRQYTAHHGSVKIRNRLVEHYLPLALAIARDIRKQLPDAVDRDLLESAAYLALIKCVSEFDPGRGAKFSGFLRHRIRGEFRDSLRAMDHLPRTDRHLRTTVDKTRRQREETLGRSVNIGEVGDVVPDEVRQAAQRRDSAVKQRKLKHALHGFIGRSRMMQQLNPTANIHTEEGMVSLSAKVAECRGEDRVATLADTIPSKVSLSEDQAQLRELLATQRPIVKTVLYRYCILEESPEQISDVTHEALTCVAAILAKFHKEIDALTTLRK